MLAGIASVRPIALRSTGAAPRRASALDRFELSSETDGLTQANRLRKLAQEVQAAPRPTSLEAKMLLDPARFASLEEGVAGLRKLLERAAAGLKLKTGDDEVRTREVTYLDTPDFALRQRGFVLRARAPVKAKTDVMLKFRDADLAKVAATKVTAHGEADSKFEKDVNYGENDREVYSRSAKVKVKDLPADLSGVFPALAGVGPLVPVRGRHIREERFELGQLEGKPLYLNVWRREPGDPPGLVEFSCASDDPKDEGLTRFMTSLKREAAGWLGHGGTKTDYVYAQARATLRRGC